MDHFSVSLKQIQCTESESFLNTLSILPAFISIKSVQEGDKIVERVLDSQSGSSHQCQQFTVGRAGHGKMYFTIIMGNFI